MEHQEGLHHRHRRHRQNQKRCLEAQRHLQILLIFFGVQDYEMNEQPQPLWS